MAKLRLGILGSGGIMGMHINRLKDHPDTQWVALCDTKAGQTQAFQERHGLTGNIRHYTDPAKMYAEADLDAVFIATPHTLHFEHGMQALEAGVHVFMEKPMVTDADHAYTLAAKVKETGLQFAVGYNTSCTPAFNWIRDQIRAGRFGKLELVTGYLSQGWMKATVGLWRQIPELSGGGQAYDSGAHLFNSLVWSVESAPKKVFAMLDNHGTPVDINSVISIAFENGVLANITISGNCPANAGFMTFIFENGKIDCDGWGGSWIKAWDGNKEIDITTELGAANNATLNFIDAVQGKDTVRANATNGIYHTELMDAIYASGRTGLPASPKSR